MSNPWVLFLVYLLVSIAGLAIFVSIKAFDTGKFKRPGRIGWIVVSGSISYFIVLIAYADSQSKWPTTRLPRSWIKK